MLLVRVRKKNILTRLWWAGKGWALAGFWWAGKGCCLWVSR